jgi:hypothetical protein
MTKDQANGILRGSIERLQRDDEILLRNDVSERAVTHRLAMYVEEGLAPLGLAELHDGTRIHVDCEYNRNMEEGVGEPKRLKIVEDEVRALLESGDLNEDERRSVTTYPDIIVHHRGFNDHNLLVVEVKMTTNRTLETLDIAKLRAFTEPPGPNRYCYVHGVFIVLGAAGRWEMEPTFRWFCNGDEI